MLFDDLDANLEYDGEWFILFYLSFRAMVNKILLNIFGFFQIFFFGGGIDELGKLELESGT